MKVITQDGANLKYQFSKLLKISSILFILSVVGIPLIYSEKFKENGISGWVLVNGFLYIIFISYSLAQSIRDYFFIKKSTISNIQFLSSEPDWSKGFAYNRGFFKCNDDSIVSELRSLNGNAYDFNKGYEACVFKNRCLVISTSTWKII